jgi:hypothetical protein
MSNLPAKLADVDAKTILQRYLSDESTKDIASSYGITRQALGQHLLKVAEAEWKDAQVARAVARREAEIERLDSIQNAIATADQEQRAKLKLSLACAERSLAAAQWDLERVCRRIYGQEAPTAQQAVQVVINLRREHATNAVQHDDNHEVLVETSPNKTD